MSRAAALVLLLAGTPAWAQSLELTPLASFTSAGAIDRTAAGIDDLAIDGGPAWGAQATWFVSPHVGVEGLWTYRSTSLSMSTTSVTTELFTLNTHQILANVVYQFGAADDPVRPFAFGGIGATVFDARDFGMETKAAWTVGGGLKWFPQRRVGVKTQARYAPSVLSDSSSRTCDPSGYCQGLLDQLEIGGGVVIRF